MQQNHDAGAAIGGARRSCLAATSVGGKLSAVAASPHLVAIIGWAQVNVGGRHGPVLWPECCRRRSSITADRLARRACGFNDDTATVT